MRRIALYITLAALGVVALLAVFALVGGEIGDTEWKIILTALLVIAAAAVSLGCAVPIHDGRLGWLPYLGIASAAAGFGMLIMGVWADDPWDVALKLAVSLVIASVVIALIGLLDAARVEAGHRWVVVSSQALSGTAGALLIAGLWGEFGGGWFWRATGVALVLTAAAAIAVPVLHRLDAIPRSSDPIHERAVEHCPYCGAGVHGPHATRLTCDACGESFRVLH
jgi:hypothetical protein